MDRIIIRGGRRLQGRIPISGAKNAALPLMIAALLTEEPLTLSNVPRLADVALLQRILRELGAHTTLLGRKAGEDPFTGDVLRIHAEEITNLTAPYELVSRMRASFWVIGPLLARCGRARVSLPGGCAIGTRPVNFYLDALSRMGADIDIEQGYVVAEAPKGLKGAHIIFPKVSVGATHVAMMAATLAKGETLIENAAREPEVADLARCLVAMGARIEGAGTSTIRIQGVERLHGAEHHVLPDRIETATYAMAAAMTGGEVLLTGTRADMLEAFIEVMDEAGIAISEEPEGLRVRRNGGVIRPVTVETQPYPGFPTDLQAQLMALMTRADGVSVIRETIFENRFMHVQELARLGADIRLAGDTATVRGVERLIGAPVMATDLRASVSLVIAGLAAEGTTELNRVYHLDRGFEALERKLAAVGADIERVSG
jgi:UDP-N-acetylglucosamine 1-carboxyvinyltransferase